MKNNPSLTIYLKKLTKLRQGVTRYGKAPHKPVLLISFIELFEKGEITENKIYISPELVALFKETFALLVRTTHTSDFSLPFYHLSAEGFWTVKTKLGASLNLHIRSINTLNEIVDFGYFATDLYTLLINTESRNILKTALLDHYFPDTKEVYLKKSKGGYIQDLKSYLLNESPAGYTQVVNDTDEEEQFIRGGMFKKLVPQVYNHTCCITGMRLVSNHGFSMIDACHIIPFSLSKDDRINNGLALCPNLHRAFDRGLISINERLKVIVSESIAEDLSNNYALMHLKGRSLALPFGEKHYPNDSNLAWHRQHIFKG